MKTYKRYFLYLCAWLNLNFTKRWDLILYKKLLKHTWLKVKW